MATIPRAAEGVPTLNGDITSTQLADNFNNILDFVESNNIDENNVDYSSPDGIVTMQNAQTISGAKTFSATVTVGASILLSANDGGALGASGTAFSDLFLASGGVINWATGTTTQTQSNGQMVFQETDGQFSLVASATDATTAAAIVTANSDTADLGIQTRSSTYAGTFAGLPNANLAIFEASQASSIVISTINGSGADDIVFAPARTEVARVTSAGLQLATATEATVFIDAGSAAATEQDWIEVTVGGNTGYIRVYAAK